MSVTYRGDVLELHGTKWDLPRELPIEQAASWIEEQWIREEMEKAAAAQEEQMEAEAALEASVPPPSPEPEPEPEVTITPPQDPKPVGAADALAISSALTEQRERARDAAAQNQQILDQIRQAQAEVAEEKKQIIQLTQTNQRLMNQAFSSYATRLKEAQVELAMLRQRIDTLKQEGK